MASHSVSIMAALSPACLFLSKVLLVRFLPLNSLWQVRFNCVKYRDACSLASDLFLQLLNDTELLSPSISYKMEAMVSSCAVLQSGAITASP